MTPNLSIIILTLDEEEHIGDCLTALARQHATDFEVIVVDAASTDGTLDIVTDAQKDFPVPLRLEAADRRLPVGEARNRGVQLAQAPNIAFLSADVEAAPGWVEAALDGLEHADVVFGRQVHAPPHRTIAAAVRGLRYHFPKTSTDEPARYASNANAALQHDVLEAFPFGSTAEAGAVDDLLLTERAREAGFAIAYNPAMVVEHHDVTTLRGELTKNLREAAGWGAHARELGLHVPVLAWGTLLVAAIILAAWVPTPLAFGLLAGLTWLPAARRVTRRAGQMAPVDLVLGFLASPPFDLAFLVQYVGSLIQPRRSPNPDATEETQA